MTTVARSPLAFPSDGLTARGDAFSTADANAHVADAAVPWLPSASTSRDALENPRGWYQHALAAEASVRSRANVMHLATDNLSLDERHEAQAFTRDTLERGDERVRPFVLPADSYSWSTPMWSALVKDRQHVVSHVGIIYRVVQVGHARVPVGGVAGVMTLPAWRRRGFARAALESATAFIGIQLWAPFALAICPKEDTVFYEHLGWTVADAAVWCEQPGCRVALRDEVALFFACQGEANWPNGAMDLLGAPW